MSEEVDKLCEIVDEVFGEEGVTTTPPPLDPKLEKELAEFREWKKAKEEAEENMVFSAKRVQKPVTIIAENGLETKYMMRELDGPGRDKWLSMMNNKLKLGPDGKTQIMTNPEGVERKLLSWSLFDSENKNVDEKVISTWPAMVIEALFLKALRLSGLDKRTAVADAKNG